MAAGVTILRPGLVLGDTSYGGSSLVRALAALPWVTPVVGQRRASLQPDPCRRSGRRGGRVSDHPARTRPVGHRRARDADAGRPDGALRALDGLAAGPALRFRHGVARVMGRLGDALRLGPMSRTAVAQLETGVLADPAAAAGPDRLGRAGSRLRHRAARRHAGSVARAAVPAAARDPADAGRAVAGVGPCWGCSCLANQFLPLLARSRPARCGADRAGARRRGGRPGPCRGPAAQLAAAGHGLAAARHGGGLYRRADAAGAGPVAGAARRVAEEPVRSSP